MTHSGSPRSAVVFNPVKVGDVDALRDDVTTVLEVAGWPAVPP